MKKILIILVSALFISIPTGVLAADIEFNTTSFTKGETKQLKSTTSGYSIKDCVSQDTSVATVESSTCKVTGVKAGDVSIVFTVVNDSDSTEETNQVVSINVKEPVIDYSIKSLVVKNGTLSPSFTKEKKSYTVKKEKDASLEITATVLDSDNAKVEFSPSDYAKASEITINVLDKSSNQVKNTYILNVTEEEKKKDDFNISVTGATMSPSFDVNTTEYKVNVTDFDKFEIKATGYDMFNPADYKKNKNDKITIKSNGKNYVLTVTYPKDEAKTDEEKKEDTAYLSKLSILGYPFQEAFDREKLDGDYKITVGFDITTVTIEAIAEDEEYKVSARVVNTKAGINTKKDGNTSTITVSDLTVGGNTIEITVTNGKKTNKYKVYVERSDKSVIEENSTSIITSGANSSSGSDYDIPDVEDPDSTFNKIVVTLASLGLLAMGGLGIYFFISTSPKRMKKEILQKNKTNSNTKDNVQETPKVEVENKFSVIEELDLEPTKEYNKNKDL